MIRFCIVVSLDWLTGNPKFDRRVVEQGLVPLSETTGGLEVGCKIQLKIRNPDGHLVVDPDAELGDIKGFPVLRSAVLSKYLRDRRVNPGYLALYFEGTKGEARCSARELRTDVFAVMEADDPSLRLESFGLPPETAIVVDAEHLVDSLYRQIKDADPELVAVHASNFLDAPHILIPLFEHVLGLGSKEQIDFSVRLQKLAEQLRTLLQDPRSKAVRIEKVVRNHSDAWAEVLGDRIAFLDGGVARIVGMPGSEPLAMRIGIYSVRPGVEDPHEREQWALKPYVIGDIIEPAPGARPGDGETADRKRLQEAARYVLEPLTAIAYLEENTDVRVMFSHGPLVNQFAQYDEGEPNFLPCLTPAFLDRFAITQEAVESELQDIPVVSGSKLWNQFMAIYGVIQKKVFAASQPIVGIVERARGRRLTLEILKRLEQDGVVTESYTKKVRETLDKYDISDDFLFGCVLAEGEYTTPVRISKNDLRQVRERWKTVVEQYPRPFASFLKTSETSFPFRLELNKTAAEHESNFVFRLLYHTSRLLPRYAFPVGLDIVDKYAKVPDWIARGVSARLSADVLRRALKTGDPRLVSQVRLFLARTPRDFFFRPQA